MVVAIVYNVILYKQPNFSECRVILFSYFEHLYFRENLPSHFKFKEYCPQVFRNLRDRFGIDDQDYLVRACCGVRVVLNNQSVCCEVKVVPNNQSICCGVRVVPRNQSVCCGVRVVLSN